jgi:hypothetical protein
MSTFPMPFSNDGEDQPTNQPDVHPLHQPEPAAAVESTEPLILDEALIDHLAVPESAQAIRDAGITTEWLMDTDKDAVAIMTFVYGFMDRHGEAPRGDIVRAEFPIMGRFEPPTSPVAYVIERLANRHGHSRFNPILTHAARNYAYDPAAAMDYILAEMGQLRRDTAGGFRRARARALPMSEVEPKPINWLEDGWVAKGAVTLLGGDPGLGKSTWTIDLAARLSRGELTGLNRPGSTVFVTVEDSIDSVTVPRMIAAGADRSRVFAVGYPEGRSDTITLPDGLPDLKAVVTEAQADLVVVDPINAFLPSGINSWNDQSIRAALMPLQEFAEQQGLAVLAVLHLNKNSSEKSALYRIGGSIGYTGAARSVLVWAEDPSNPERRVLAQAKSNWGPKQQSRVYDMETVSLGGDYATLGIEVGRVKFAEYVDADADTLLAAPRKRRSDATTDEAQDALLADAASWVPTNSDDAQDADWYSSQLDTNEGIRLHPKTMQKLLNDLYEWGYHFLPAKSGTGGHKARFWRITSPGEAGGMAPDDLNDLDDDDLGTWLDGGTPPEPA